MRDEINAGTPGDALVGSLVAQVEEEADAAQSHHARTFRIIAGPPRGSSYASEIAEQHGISYPQLEELLHEPRTGRYAQREVLIDDGNPAAQGSQQFAVLRRRCVVRPSIARFGSRYVSQIRSGLLPFPSCIGWPGPVAGTRSYGLGAGPSTLYFRSALRSATGSTSTTTLDSPTTSPLESKL